MELNSIKDAFDRVTKKQKLSGSKMQEVVDQISQEIEKALEKIQSASSPVLDHRSVLNELYTSLHNTAPLSQLEGPQKELNSALTKYVKTLEKSFNPDISKAYRNVDFDTHSLNQIIASHFYQQGFFDLGDQFISEAREPEATAIMKSPFQEMFRILEAMKNRDLRPAIDWANTVSDKLAQRSDLIFRLHSMEFLEIVQSGSKNEALLYARAKLAPLATAGYELDFQKVMVCILWCGKLDQCPHESLVLPNAWDLLVEHFTRDYCYLLGQSYKSPLSVTVEAGIQALPPLLKFLNVVVGKRQEWQTMNHLPVPVELDREFQFHSVFVCPVSKEQSTEDNPPMYMPCGHVLCKQSITKMSKNNTKTFKCPYCPYDVDAAHCRQIYF